MVQAVAGIRAADTSGVGPCSLAEANRSADIGWRDVVDALNPLEHLPFVSTLFDEMTGHKPSSGSQLAGGTLLGGPIGFVASLVNVVFQGETGQGVGGTMVAALSGDDASATTQVASIDAGAAANASPEELSEIAPAAGGAAVEVGTISAKDNAVLDLYGGSAASAHSSYQKAQMRPYLNDVTVSKVL